MRLSIDRQDSFPSS